MSSHKQEDSAHTPGLDSNAGGSYFMRVYQCEANNEAKTTRKKSQSRRISPKHEGEAEHANMKSSNNTSALGMLPSNGNTSIYNTSASHPLKGKALKLNQSAGKLMTNNKNQFVNDRNDPTLQSLNERVNEELNQVK